MRSRLLEVLLGLGIAGVSMLAVEQPAAADAGPALDDFGGLYRYQGSPGKTAQIHAAIDSATEDMIMLKRLARSRLYETSVPHRIVGIKLVGEDVSVGWFGERAIVSELGERVPWTNRFGDKVKLTQSFRNGKLVHVLEGQMNSRQRKTLSLSADRSKLFVDVRVTAPIIPEPIVYRLVYERR